MAEELGIIQKIALEGASQTVQALAVSQQMGMISSEEDLIQLISAGMETVLEEYIAQIENQSKIILDETSNFRKDS